MSDTAIIVIVVAVAVVLVVLIVAAAMRGRDQSRTAARRDLDDAHERAGRADRDRDNPQQRAEPKEQQAEPED